MQCIIIAGGVSSRLQPIPDKNLLSFFGETLIERQLRILSTIHDTVEAIVVCNPSNRDRIEKVLSHWSAKHPVQFLTQEKPDGLEDAMLCAEKLVRDNPVMVIASNDVVEESAYQLLIDTAAKSKADAVLLASEVQSYFPGGYIESDATHLIKRIVEKPEPGTEPSNLVSIVIHWHRSGTALMEQLRAAQKKSEGRHVFDVMIDQMVAGGKRCVVAPYKGAWQAVKYPWHVLDLMQLFFTMPRVKPNRASTATIAPTAVLNGAVWVEDDVRIFDHAVIQGPAYLARGSVIGNGTLVRESYIGEGTTIGFGSEIARSYLGKGIYTHTNYIGDSVVGDDCSFGSGMVTGNYRLDQGPIAVSVGGTKVNSGKHKLGAFFGPGVRTGINSSTMPGVKIGAQSFIGAGVVVSANVDAGMYCATKQEHTIRENKHSSS